MSASRELRELSRNLSPTQSSITARRERDDVEREMRDCLERPRVWQKANLMTPHRTNRFSERGGMQKAGE